MRKKLKIFSRWEKRSAVRNAPRRIITATEKKKFFSANLAPILKCKLVQQLEESVIRKIEIQLLYHYLHFTEYLETSLVNKVIAGIMNDEFSLIFEAELKDAAYKIYCDEAYHALQAHDTIAQIKSISGEKPMDFPLALVARLKELREKMPLHLLPLFELFFVCVSETLVSQELRNHVIDQEIHPGIQEIMKDHANDEAIHAVFFAEIMRCLKQQLPKADYQCFLNFIPLFLKAYLIPDRANLTAIFSPYLAPDSISIILKQVLNPTATGTFVAASSTQLYRTIKELEKINDDKT